MKTPMLQTERLILRPFCMEDSQDVFECLESDPDVAKYMFWSSHNDIKKTIGWVKNVGMWVHNRSNAGSYKICKRGIGDKRNNGKTCKRKS